MVVKRHRIFFSSKEKHPGRYHIFWSQIVWNLHTSVKGQNIISGKLVEKKLQYWIKCVPIADTVDNQMISEDGYKGPEVRDYSWCICKQTL